MFSRTQTLILGLLITLPILLFAGAGAWALWETNRLIWLSWSIPVCWGLAWGLRRLWRRPLILTPPELDATLWTPRDEAAAEIIRQEQAAAQSVPAERLTDLSFYQEATQQLAEKIARHYHPGATDPVGKLTVLEILATTQLVAEDLGEWFEQHVPGSHLITVSQWRMLSQAPKLWQYASNAGWIASILINPVNLGRYFVSKLAVDPLSRELQGNFLTAFYLLYLRQVGFYLIEMNSGRLRGGAAKYRETQRRMHPSTTTVSPSGTATNGPATPPEAPLPVTVTIAVIGQVKAGKSSLVNCLLGEQRAAVDVLPATRAVQRYRLQSLSDHHSHDELILLDTAGYAEAGASREQLADTVEAVRQADLVLAVLDSKSPAKHADLAVVEDLAAWHRAHPQQKPPPIIGVVSKIDGLSPVLEWQPPYAWTRPARPKEQHIAGAIDYVRDQFGAHFTAVVPVCTDQARGRAYGVTEFLVPAMSSVLTEARAASLLKTLHQEQDRGKLLRVVQQAVNAGRQLVDFWKQRPRTDHTRTASSLTDPPAAR